MPRYIQYIAAGVLFLLCGLAAPVLAEEKAADAGVQIDIPVPLKEFEGGLQYEPCRLPG